MQNREREKECGKDALILVCIYTGLAFIYIKKCLHLLELSIIAIVIYVAIHTHIELH